MRDVYEAARELQRFCRSRRWWFCFIGGIAYQRWGEPRVTLDADISLLTGFGGEEEFVDALLQEFVPRRNDARSFALLRRVVLLKTRGGTPVDVALAAALPFEEHCIAGATAWPGSGEQPLTTCTVEDLVVHKAFADRDRDWADIERVVMRQGKKLNIAQVFAQLRPLVGLKEEPEILNRLQRVLDKHLD